MTITNFRKFCKDTFPNARIEKLRDKDKQNYHITLRDITRDEVYSTLQNKGYEVKPSLRTHSNAYTGNSVLFENETVYFCVRDKNTNATHYMRRKEVTPDAIGLGGKTFADSRELKQATLKGLLACTGKDNVRALMSLLDLIDGTGNLQNKHILQTDKSRITSDFGEVASAYARTVKNQTVFFPKESNYPAVDFFANDVGVSAKGDKGSSRLSVVDYKDIINTFGDTNPELLLKALANREIYKVLEVASEVCDELAYWKNKLGEFSLQSLKTYIANNAYDTYVQDIKDCQNGAVLGLPTKETECRVYWSKGDHNPILFTLLTLLDRYYSEQNIVELSSVVTGLFTDTNIEFEYFDYNVECERIDINVLPISQYKTWKINYWGNAASALNNWPAVKGIV